MTKMHCKAMLMAPLLTLLYGCQPDAPAQQAVPAPVVSAVAATAQAPAAAQVAAAKPETKPEAPAAAGAVERALAQKHGCFACHMIEKKLVGPSWNEIAAKYRGQKGAEATLISKVAKGGRGTWGATPMPPNSPKVGEADIKTLVRYILSLK